MSEASAFSDYVVYVDESGDHSLTSIDDQYPVFVLSFCIFHKEVYTAQVAAEVRRLKFRTFGHDMVVLHEHAIRKKTGAFSRLGKAEREAFMEALTAIMDAADFTLVAVVIDKRRLTRRYREPAHPYHLAMEFGLERLDRLLASRGQARRLTHVICEARGAEEDRELELQFRRICDGANKDRRPYPFEILICDKKTNSEGLQLADLTARPVGLSILRPDQPNRAMDVLNTKFHRSERGVVQGYGLKCFP
jgi:hypothetical protein